MELPCDPESYFCVDTEMTEVNVPQGYLDSPTHFSTVPANQDTQIANMPICGQMDKESVPQRIHNCINVIQPYNEKTHLQQHKEGYSK